MQAFLKQVPNIFVTCTKSGKRDKNKVKEYIKEVIVKATVEKACLILDAWLAYRDKSIYVSLGKFL